MISIGPLVVLGTALLVIVALLVIIVVVIVRATSDRSRRRPGSGADGAALGGATYADSQGWDSDDRHHDSGSGWFGDSGADAGGGSGWFGGGDSGGDSGGGDGGGSD